MQKVHVQIPHLERMRFCQAVIAKSFNGHVPLGKLSPPPRDPVHTDPSNENLFTTEGRQQKTKYKVLDVTVH